MADDLARLERTELISKVSTQSLTSLATISDFMTSWSLAIVMLTVKIFMVSVKRLETGRHEILLFPRLTTVSLASNTPFVVAYSVLLTRTGIMRSNLKVFFEIYHYYHANSYSLRTCQKLKNGVIVIKSADLLKFL